MTASHDYRIADLEAENAKLRAELAAPRAQPGVAVPEDVRKWAERTKHSYHAADWILSLPAATQPDAATPAPQLSIAVPEDVRAAAKWTMERLAEWIYETPQVCARWILSLPAASPAPPQPDAELQRLLDEFRSINDDNGWASAQTRLLEALARKVGCE